MKAHVAPRLVVHDLLISIERNIASRTSKRGEEFPYHSRAVASGQQIAQLTIDL
jgi:hypothetical protein